jgi:hypothetical protein
MKTIALATILAMSVAILRNLAGENVDCATPQNLRPVTAWPWESHNPIHPEKLKQ